MNGDSHASSGAMRRTSMGKNTSGRLASMAATTSLSAASWASTGRWNSISLNRMGRSVDSSFQPSSTASSGWAAADSRVLAAALRNGVEKPSRLRMARSMLRKSVSVSGPRGIAGASVSSWVMLAARPVNGTA